MLTWDYAGTALMLGGRHPQIHPSIPAAFPLVRDLLDCSGESDALMTWYKSPGQRAFSDKVELGGIEPSRAFGRRTSSAAIAADQSAFSSVLQWPPVTRNGLHLPPFCRPVRPFTALP